MAESEYHGEHHTEWRHTGQNVWCHVCYAMSTVFGTGYVPLMPGTIASTLALLICLIPQDVRFMYVWGGIIGACIIGIICIPIVEKERGDDASLIVIDEVAGMWVTIASPLVPHTVLWLITGFILFRYFDIVKPGLIAHINRRKGAVYVMADDIVAGVLACVCLHVLYAGYLSIATLWYMVK
jgi:phosphatidylglycerophosphatase A